MEGCERVVLLILGLSLVTHSASEVHLYGVYPWEDVTGELNTLRTQKLQLEENLVSPEYETSRNAIELELKNVNDLIEYLEDTSRVMYRDLKQTVEEQRQYFEKEKEGLRRRMIVTENARIGALRVMGKIKTHQDEINSYQQQLEELSREKDQVTVEYAALTALQYQQQNTMNKQMNNIILERKEIKQKLVQAQDLHSRALEAMAIATQEGYTPISIPHQNAIDELRDEMREYQGLQETDPTHRLLSTQEKLQSLLKILYTEGEIPNDEAFKDMEDKLAQIEMEAVRVRDQHDNERKNILDRIRNNGFTINDEDEITSLKIANQRVLDTTNDLKEIARRSAYLKAISQVKDIITECSSKIRDAMAGTAVQVGQQQQTVNSEYHHQNDEEFFEDPERIYDMIHQKYLLYKDLNEFYRNKLSTEIVIGLAKMNKRFPFAFPGCPTTRLVEIREQISKWADGVQYALRLSKALNKGGNRSMIARFFVEFLKSLRNAFHRLMLWKIEEETNLVDDDSMTTSIEMFENQEEVDFNNHFEYINTNLNVLDVDKEVSDALLQEFRYNFIFVKRAPEALQETALRMLEELRNESDETNMRKQLMALRDVSKEMDVSEKRLRELFSTLISDVKSSFAKKDREYQESLEEYKNCRYNILKAMPMYGYLSK